MKEVKFSASKIKAWLQCPTLWAATYLAGNRGPASGGQLAGSRVHKILEDYLIKGKEIDTKEVLVFGNKTYHVGRTASLMSKYLPAKGSVPKEHVEREFTFEIQDPDFPETYKFGGFVDLEHGKIYDHKSVRDMQYALKEPALKEDIQVIIYVLEALHSALPIKEKGPYVIGKWPGETEIECQWNYAETTADGRARAVPFVVSRAEAEDVLRRVIIPACREIKKAYEENKDWKSHRKVLTQCGAYGGCAHRGQCGPSANERGLAMLTKEQIMAKINAKRAATVTEVVPESGERIATTVTQPPEVKSRLEEIRAKSRQVNPDPPTEPEPVVTEADPAPEAPAPKRRGRPPTKAKVNVEQDPQAPRAVVLYDDTAQHVKEGAALTTGGYVLYVNCRPLRGPVTEAFDLIAAASATVCNEGGVPHVKLIDYGKGEGFLAAQLRENLQANPVTGALVTNDRTPEGRATLQVLCEMASNIVM